MTLSRIIQPNQSIHIPPWTVFHDLTNGMPPHRHCNPPVTGCPGSPYCSPFLLGEAMAAMQRYLPSNEIAAFDHSDCVASGNDDSDELSCDEFRMYEFKVRRCARARFHDWTDCPFSHPGEKARRRDPRNFHYSSVACPDFRKGSCKRGDACEYAHGVFEFWLHPSRYRTQPCKDGTACRRRVCFFAHTPEQLRVLPKVVDGPPSLKAGFSGPSVRHPSMLSRSASEVQSRLSEARLRSPTFSCFPSTPVGPLTPAGRSGWVGFWDMEAEADRLIMESVNPDRRLRFKTLEILRERNSAELPESAAGAPDVGWVSELLM